MERIKDVYRHAHARREVLRQASEARAPTADEHAVDLEAGELHLGLAEHHGALEERGELAGGAHHGARRLLGLGRARASARRQVYVLDLDRLGVRSTHAEALHERFVKELGAPREVPREEQVRAAHEHYVRGLVADVRHKDGVVLDHSVAHEGVVEGDGSGRVRVEVATRRTEA